MNAIMKTDGKIIVQYWVGTMRHIDTANTYAEAMEIVSRNQGPYGPRFLNENGDELHDDGNGLATEADIATGQYSF